MKILYDKKLKDEIGNIFISFTDKDILVIISPFLSEPKLFSYDEIPANLFDMLNLRLGEENKTLFITNETNFEEKDYMKKFFSKLMRKNPDSKDLFIFMTNNLHAKLILSKKYAFFGSMNLTYSGLNFNKELAVKIEDDENLKLLKKYFGNLLIEAKPKNENAKLLKNWLEKKGLLDLSKQEKIYDEINNNFKLK